MVFSFLPYFFCPLSFNSNRNKPVIASQTVNGKKSNAANQKNEIFVDILEKLNVMFSNNGYLLNSTIDGCIQMKSFLTGNPELRLALNEDLTIGKVKLCCGVTVLL